MLGAFVAQDLALFVLFFDLMLVPFYFLVGQWGGPDRVRGGDEDGHLHARRLAADARRRGGDGGARARRAGGHDLVRALATCSANPLPRGTQKWIFVAFALAFLIKMPAFPFHGWMPDAYRAMPLPALAFFSGVRLEGRRLRLPAPRAAAVPGRDATTSRRDPADPRAGLDPLRLGAGVHADQRAADPRLLVGRAARVHHARDLRARPGRPGRAGRAAAGGQPRARGRAAVLRRRAAGRARRAARRTSATTAGSRSARRCWRCCS